MIARRGFLAGMLALGASPAIVHASSIMRIAPPRIIVPQWVSPIGTIQLFAGPPGDESRLLASIKTDMGWVPCDGRTVSRSLFPYLSAAIAPMVTNPGREFQLPDLRPKFFHCA